MADFNMDKPVSTENGNVILDNDAVTKVFKKIKKANILNESLHFSFSEHKEPPIELLNTDDFIDKIKYYRLYKGYSQRQVAIHSGIFADNYWMFENKKYEIQSAEIAEKLIKFLNIENDVELPDYFVFMKKYPLEKLKNFIDKKMGRKNFSKITGISPYTINSWYEKDRVKIISTYTYKKIVKGFKENHIKF